MTSFLNQSILALEVLAGLKVKLTVGLQPAFKNAANQIMKKRRKYNTRRISSKMSYSVQEIAELCSLHKNAVLTWVRSGLKTIDQKKPYLINGAVLIEYINNKQKSRKHKCKPNELFCFKCRQPRKPKTDSVSITTRNIHRLKISAKCEVCETKMFKEASVQRRPELEKTYSVVLQTQEHILGCNNLSVNSVITEGK
jgi:hypothetical protein